MKLAIAFLIRIPSTFFFFKQKTAYEIVSRDWSSDVCSSDLDIGGIIVIDFIDMAYTRNRDHVLSVLRKALDEDRTRTHVVEISPLGLVEMTRQNVSEGVREIMNKTCPTCQGEGVVRSEETIAIDVERRLRKLVKDSKSEAFLVQVHPRVAAILIGGGGKPLRELEEATGKVFHFHGSEGSRLDTFEITA